MSGDALDLLDSTDPDDLERLEGLALVAEAEAFRVASNEDYSRAADALSTIKAFQKEVHRRLDPVCKAADEAHKKATALRNSLLEYPNKAEAIYKEKMGLYAAAQKREKRRLEELAAQEQAMAVEVARRDGTPVPALVVPPERTVEVPTARGVSVSEPWRGRVKSKRDLIVAIAVDTSGALDHLLDVNQRAVDERAKALQANLNLPGVEAYQGTQVSVRT